MEENGLALATGRQVYTTELRQQKHDFASLHPYQTNASLNVEARRSAACVLFSQMTR